MRKGRSITQMMLAGMAAAVLMTGPIAVAEEVLGDPDDARYEELEKARSAFKETWVLPGVDFSNYSKVMFWAAEFEYRDVGPAEKTRSSMIKTHKREFGISEEDRREFENVVREAFRKEMAKGKKFTVTDSIGADTLILRGALLDVVSLVPPPTVARSDVYLSTLGEATFVMEVLDSRTGNVLALVSERRRIQPPGGGQIDSFSLPANRVTVTNDVRRWATSAASKLRKALDKAMK